VRLPHHIFTKNLKSLSICVISLICCLKSTISYNVERQITLDTLTSVNQVSDYPHP